MIDRKSGTGKSPKAVDNQKHAPALENDPETAVKTCKSSTGQDDPVLKAHGGCVSCKHIGADGWSHTTICKDCVDANKFELEPQPAGQGDEFERVAEVVISWTEGTFPAETHRIKRAISQLREGHRATVAAKLSTESELVLDTLESNRLMRDEGKYRAPFSHENVESARDALVTKEIALGKQHVRIAELKSENAQLKAENEQLEAWHKGGRWNAERTEDGVRICFGNHEGDDCEFENFVRESERDQLEADLEALRTPSRELRELSRQIVSPECDSAFWCGPEWFRPFFEAVAARENALREQVQRITELESELAAFRAECIANPEDEKDKPELGDDEYATQWARDTLSGRAKGGRCPWGQRNLAKAYLNQRQHINTLEAELAARKVEQSLQFDADGAEIQRLQAERDEARAENAQLKADKAALEDRVGAWQTALGFFFVAEGEDTSSNEPENLVEYINQIKAENERIARCYESATGKEVCYATGLYRVECKRMEELREDKRELVAQVEWMVAEYGAIINHKPSRVIPEMMSAANRLIAKHKEDMK